MSSSLRATFDTFDKNKDGTITFNEFAQVCKNVGVSDPIGLFQEWCGVSDVNDDNKITWEEFKNAFGSIQ